MGDRPSRTRRARPQSEPAHPGRRQAEASTAEKYRLKHHVRVLTATALFDGHDAAINIVRRLMQASGAEVIHLGHDRSVREIAEAAIQEDVQAVAVTSYQGGHMEFYKYLRKTLAENGGRKIRIFGGGGGVILPEEIRELHRSGITRIYSPEDGRALGLQGMIDDLLRRSDFPAGAATMRDAGGVGRRDFRAIARVITAAENDPRGARALVRELRSRADRSRVPVVGVTGTGGAGKSSLIDEVLRRFLADFPDGRVAVLAVDPSKRMGGGALLGDRIRLNSASDPRVFVRSMATRRAKGSVSGHVRDALTVVGAAGFDLVVLETSGIGQADTEIADLSDLPIYVMTPDYGAPTQLEKIGMLDLAAMVVLNKSDRRGASDALRAVKKQYARSHPGLVGRLDEAPVFETVASEHGDPGVDRFYRALLAKIGAAPERQRRSEAPAASRCVPELIPEAHSRYLAEIAETVRGHRTWVDGQVRLAQSLYGIREAIGALRAELGAGTDGVSRLESLYERLERRLDPECKALIEEWPARRAAYGQDQYSFHVREREVRVKTHTTSLSNSKIPKVALPRYEAWGDLLRWLLKENVPGEFPYAAGVFPFKREEEDPTRMFAGEGGPERTNRRFHLLSRGMPASRLSTAFDSVTLYGADPAVRPDIYGKVGNSGVSVACLDDAKKLYSGFHLADSKTSVSMTINGPAPTMVAYFMNAAVDQECERHIHANGLRSKVEKTIDDRYRRAGVPRPRYQGERPPGNDGLGLMLLGTTGDQVLPRETYERIKADTLKRVRGTVQADILKEDQAQNTCIFSIDFALKLMGDLAQYFLDHGVRNFYSVSISGYHIAEAGANPITQLAFTLANGFTYVEYFRARGMAIDRFAPNLSFFFSNGLDPEFSVIGRVARLIWAKAMRYRYKANDRSQKLKYHIQTSGRSLHAQEIGFNDIRTTLQALYAIYDNCNSLHTNAADEAITTPTEASVRRAMAIQLIINRELGLARNENPLQGAFVVEELTDLVEEAVLSEFERLNARGGVLGAMETMYQRNRIQEESLHYEELKHSGQLPVVGVNTFLSPERPAAVRPGEVTRATERERRHQVAMLGNLHKVNAERARESLDELKRAVASGSNAFERLMEAAKVCSLGQVSSALYEGGGQYRRSM
jgi:isobutyryl-CoA mutase